MAHRKSVVNSQMGGGFGNASMKGASGMYDRSPAPFDKPHSMGNGGVPVKMMETGPGKTPTPTQTAGMESRVPRPGTKQRAFGTSNT